MELIVAIGLGVLAGCGIYLMLRPTTFSIVLGLTLLSYAVNLLIFMGGRLNAAMPPLVMSGTSGHADPLPQALVLTAIVIGFGMTAYLLALALRAKGESGSDRVDTGGER
jgi:multicomponent K+:H+ antiporter subunit C